MKRSRLAALPVTVLGVVATGALTNAAVAQPDPVDATPPLVVRPIPEGVGPVAEEDLLDVPAEALAAYGRAGAILEPVDPACGLGPELLAAIGKVESDHGRLAVPAPVPLPPDTDGGAWDMDPDADHALGPLQLPPPLWQQVAVDGDGDGLRDPADLDDAALALGIVLCAGEEDLATAEGRDVVLRGLNDQAAYVEAVEAYLAAYVAPPRFVPVRITSVARLSPTPPAARPIPAAKPAAAPARSVQAAPAPVEPTRSAAPPAPVAAAAEIPAPVATAPAADPPATPPPPVTPPPPAPEPTPEPTPVPEEPPAPIVEPVVVAEARTVEPVEPVARPPAEPSAEPPADEPVPPADEPVAAAT